MTDEFKSERLGTISTHWSLVRRAHGGPEDVAESARRQLLERYGGAVRRYLQKVVGDPHAADDVFQEFALRLVRGDLCGATPERGRYRNFVKGVLFHLIADHRLHQWRWPRLLPAESVGATGESGHVEFDRQFLESWREELLARGWAALALADAESGQSFYAVLRFRADHPEMRSHEMAEALTARFGESFSSAGVRQLLHRARGKFAKILLDEVRASLENPPPDQLEEELVDLGLLEYCRPTLGRAALRC
jgi:DNA-directed RNA polymerase specialized sigma24 family protein